MDWNWQVIFTYLPDLLSGVALTVKLVVISGILGFIFGLGLALLRLSSNKLVQVLPFLYIFFFRGTPLLVQIFLIYYGLSQFEFIKDSFLWEPLISNVELFLVNHSTAGNLSETIASTRLDSKSKKALFNVSYIFIVAFG